MTTPKPAMPDVAIQKMSLNSEALDKVGMSHIELPIQIQTGEKDQVWTLMAQVDAFVNLITSDRGIHMSRLYKTLHEKMANKVLSVALMQAVAKEFLQTHEGLSSEAHLDIHLDLPVKRQSLKSENTGWRAYPIALKLRQAKSHDQRFFLKTQVLYSSTCPASAALARQLVQENFKKSFEVTNVKFGEVFDWLGSNQGINATPHAQRSVCEIEVELDPSLTKNVITASMDLINLVEDALKTPVQTLVKREDEQEFARRNGENLMFCEDAARRIKRALDQGQNTPYKSYLFTVKHKESLHPHDAVCTVRSQSET